MKKTIIYLLIVLPTLVFAQKNTAQLEWLNGPTIDMGEISGKGITKVKFEFKNIDSVPLTIETVRTTCSCTAVDWQKEPIQPGETASLPISFSPNHQGLVDKTIQLYFFEKRKVVKLHLKGDVVD